MRYARETGVPVDRSRGEIERILSRYGAVQFAYGWDPKKAIIQFVANQRMVRFELPIPELQEFAKTERGRIRRGQAAQEAHDQAIRQRWRALCLVIKAKLEAVESGIAEFEDEFLAYLVLPGGKSVGQWLRPQLNETYEKGRMPKMLIA